MAHHLLEGKKGLIFGALDESSIAWKVAEAAHAEGARMVLTNAPVALRMGKIQQLGEALQAPIIPADVSNQEDIKNLWEKTLEHFGGPIDFVLHSVGMSPNVRKKRPYYDLKYDWLHKTLDISAISLHRILQEAWHMDALAEKASVVALSYIAAQRAFPSYNDMAEAKALLESIVRSFGYHYGKRKGVRINAVSQSPTPTTAGTGVPGFDTFLAYAEKNSPVGNATAEDCARFCVMLFSDYTEKLTMQTLFHDGGFSMTGISEDLMDIFSAAHDTE